MGCLISYWTPPKTITKRTNKIILPLILFLESKRYKITIVRRAKSPPVCMKRESPIAIMVSKARVKDSDLKNLANNIKERKIR